MRLKPMLRLGLRAPLVARNYTMADIRIVCEKLLCDDTSDVSSDSSGAVNLRFSESFHPQVGIQQRSLLFYNCAFILFVKKLLTAFQEKAKANLHNAT